MGDRIGYHYPCSTSSSYSIINLCILAQPPYLQNLIKKFLLIIYRKRFLGHKVHFLYARSINERQSHQREGRHPRLKQVQINNNYMMGKGVKNQ